MRDTQVDRLLDLLERYVANEEAKLQIGRDQLAVRNQLDERAVAAQEHTAIKGVHIDGKMKASVNQP